jgi:hypothetical protein
VTLSPWNEVRDRPPAPDAAFSTIMTWNYFNGPLVYDGVQYDQKVSEYEKFHDLPRRVNVPLALAVGGFKQPIDQIKQDGWHWLDGWKLTLTPESYFDFIADSLGEWSVAKNVYVGTRSGWFSCRTACYLAAGRPAVVQDTGWSKFVPSGAGMFAFETMQQSIDALTRIASDAAKQRATAYDVAREYLAPDRVLPPMIDAIYADNRSDAPIAPSHSAIGNRKLAIE